MSFGNHTPESLLKRSDSKDPATTCKGITSTGRPCRRALAASIADSPAASPNRNGNGVVAVLDAGDAAVFFCWQHKDQAEVLVSKLSERTSVLPLQQKSSIDTLIERIGVIELDDEVGESRPERNARHEAQLPVQSQSHRYYSRQDSDRPRRRSTLPQEWQNIRGPLMSVPRDVVRTPGYKEHRAQPRPHRLHSPDRMGRSDVKASWGCCIQADDERLPPARKRDSRYDDRRQRPRPNNYAETRPDPRRSDRAVREMPQVRLTQSARQTAQQPQMKEHHTPGEVNYPTLESLPIHPPSTPTRPPPHQRSPSSKLNSPPHPQTATYLSLIPSHLSPATTSALLSELSKPISSSDEDGYIYIFWLTPQSDPCMPDRETASTILDPDPSPAPILTPQGYLRNGIYDAEAAQARLMAAALQRFASVKRKSEKQPKKVLLKIGRASNVHRRLSQWTRQCGQNVTLIRYYPYQPRPAESESAVERRTVPHIHRVERLIHLELADQRVAGQGKCEQCGREHREWFEVEATRDGVRAVDEVVRRWVGWAERMDNDKT